MNLSVVMAYLEYLAEIQVFIHMEANNISAIKASFVIYGLNHSLRDYPNVKHFVKAMKKKPASGHCEDEHNVFRYLEAPSLSV